MSKATELHEEVTKAVIELMETAGTDWVKSWTALGLHSQAATLTEYSGGNQFWLALVASSKGYASPFWATFKVWQGVGSQVQKGQKGTKLVRWVEKKCAEHGELGCQKGCRKTMLPVTFTVFNADQCDHDGWVPPVMGEGNPDETIERCEQFLKGSGAEIRHGGDSAFYQPATDSITLPSFDSFSDAVAYYGTAFHELTHWTGAEKRTDRHQQRGKGAFGSEEYAYEELVAELGACFLAAEFGIEPTVREDHAKYLNNWIKALKGDASLIWTAAQDASKAIKWITANTNAAEPAAEGVGA